MADFAVGSIRLSLPKFLSGSRRRELAYRIAASVGAYRAHLSATSTEVRRLVFICKGNVCRSPYAAARARHYGAPAVSFGIDARSELKANRDAIRAAKSHGIDLSSHTTSALDSYTPLEKDLVLVMDPAQISAVRQRLTGIGVGVVLLGMWARPATPLIFDPYGKSDADFERCFTIIDDAINGLLRAWPGNGLGSTSA